MKKNSKTKSIKILITSWLCGLAFTCVNVSAMEDNIEEQQQQISQEVNNNSNTYNTENENNQQTLKNNENQSQDNNNNFNTINDLTNEINTTINNNSNTTEQNTYDFNKKMQEKEILFDIFEDHYLKAQKLLKEKDYDAVNIILQLINSELKKREKYLNKYEIKHFNDKIAEISTKNENDKTDKEDIKSNENSNTIEQDYNNDGFEKRMKENIIFFENFRNYYRQIEKFSEDENFDAIDKNLKIMNSKLKNQEKYLNKDEIDYFNRKLTEISLINEEDRKNKPKEKILEELSKYYVNGIISIRNNDFKNAEENLESLIKNKKLYKTKYLDEMDLKKIDGNIKILRKMIQKEKVLKKFENYFKMVYNQIGSINYNGALETLERINLYKNKNKSYIEDDLMKKYENKIKELKEIINDKKEIKKIADQLFNIYDNASSDIAAQRITEASHKIRIMEDIITKNREKLEEEYNNFNEFEKEIDELKKDINDIETMKETEKKKNS